MKINSIISVIIDSITDRLTWINVMCSCKEAAIVLSSITTRFNDLQPCRLSLKKEGSPIKEEETVSVREV